MAVRIAVINDKTTHKDIFSPIIKTNREARRGYKKIISKSKNASICPTCGKLTRLYYIPPVSDADENIGCVYCEYCGKPVLKVNDTKEIGPYNIVKIIGGNGDGNS